MSQSPNGPRTKIPDYTAVVNVRYDGISTIVKNPVDAANHKNRANAEENTVDLPRAFLSDNLRHKQVARDACCDF